MKLPKPSLHLTHVALALASLLATNAATAAEASYVTILVPGALGTFLMGINNSMTVTGYYTTSPSTAGGFIRNAHGTITTFNIQGGRWTQPVSIDDAGDVTGFYEQVADVPQGFIRYASGRVITFTPEPAGMEGPQAQPISINNFGKIAGNYPYPNSAAIGFTRSRDGAVSSFDFANGAANSTDVTGLNDAGTVVGYISPGGSYRQGYFRNSSGFFTKFDVPISTGGGELSNEVTVPEGINATGTIVGWYNACYNRCQTTVSGGFVRSPQGDFSLFNGPGLIVAAPEIGLEGEGSESLMAPHRLSIGADGTITGSYTDASGVKHGFVRNPYGTITPFDPPRGIQTTATSVNDSGVIAGFFYYDWDSQTSIGFLRLPPK